MTLWISTFRRQWILWRQWSYFNAVLFASYIDELEDLLGVLLYADLRLFLQAQRLRVNGLKWAYFNKLLSPYLLISLGLFWTAPFFLNRLTAHAAWNMALNNSYRFHKTQSSSTGPSEVGGWPKRCGSCKGRLKLPMSLALRRISRSPFKSLDNP